MSLWSAPSKVAGHGCAWSSEAHERMAWQVSSALLRRHFEHVELVTDREGWERLKPLGLPFTTVRIDLDDLDPRWAKFWSVGKIRAYSLQEEPFVHVDADAFMHKPLSPHLLADAPVLAQLPEKFRLDSGIRNYRIDQLEAHIKPLPAPVMSALRRPIQYAANFGIFGGNDLGTIRAYTDLAFGMLTGSTGWEEIGGFDGLLLLEQWLIGVALRQRRGFIEYLYPCVGGPRGYSDQSVRDRVGFVHFWAGEKRNPDSLRQLEGWHQALFPSRHQERPCSSASSTHP